MQTTDISNDIRTFLVDSFLSGQQDKLTDDEVLLGNVVDSTGVIELVNFLQERFEITVEDDEVTNENLGSVRSVTSYVQGKLRSKA
jgi:acyl carrier protein